MNVLDSSQPKTKQTVVVTGSQGFIGAYLCNELLSKDYKVIGIDNYSKYGPVSRPHDAHPDFELVQMDISLQDNYENLSTQIAKANYVIAGAAMIGGISYFHKYAYDLLRTNEMILANTFDACISAYQQDSLNRIVVISSSMVYEGADCFSEMNSYSIKPWPTKEGFQSIFPPPFSTYGFQKLSSEYFCKGAAEQYGLPYTIVRPFNCVGVGEEDALGEEAVMSGNVKLMMSHVLPDLINKCLKGQNPLRILGSGNQVRCYTNGRDIARGIVLAMESKKAINQDFNISTSRPTTVLELAKAVWSRINPDKPFEVIREEAYVNDVQKRIPDTLKASRLLNFKAEVELEESIDEVIKYMREHDSNKS